MGVEGVSPPVACRSTYDLDICRGNTELGFPTLLQKTRNASANKRERISRKCRVIRSIGIFHLIRFLLDLISSIASILFFLSALHCSISVRMSSRRRSHDTFKEVLT